MAYALVTPPPVEPLSLDEAQAHLRLELDRGDVYVGGLISAVRAWVEETINRALITQTWDLVLDAWPRVLVNVSRPTPQLAGIGMDFERVLYGRSAIDLMKGRLQSVEFVKYVDDAGVLQTLSPSAYIVDTDSEPGRIAPAYGLLWPTARQQLNAIRVRFVAGYGSAGTAVPQSIRAAMLIMISDLYEHRESEVVGATVSRVQFAADALLAPFRLDTVG
ncbi:MAG: hypothetical protein WCK73_07960 [Deltaproteobacteria bacterium]